MKIISLGINCASASALQELGIRTEAYPFDWVPNSIKIVYECIKTDFSHFCEFGHPRLIPGVNEEYFFHQQAYLFPNFPLSHRNYYGNYFTKMVGTDISEVKETMTRRCQRFLEVLRGSEEVVFVYTEEYYLYFRKFREKQEEMHQTLEKLDLLLKEKYPQLPYTILSVNINRLFPDTGRIHNLKIDWDPAFMFDKHCFESYLFWLHKMKIAEVLKTYFSEKKFEMINGIS